MQSARTRCACPSTSTWRPASSGCATGPARSGTAARRAFVCLWTYRSMTWAARPASALRLWTMHASCPQNYLVPHAAAPCQAQAGQHCNTDEQKRGLLPLPQVLAQERGNAKALFRRGRAHNGLGRTEDALRDLQEAARLAPEDRAIAREIAAVRAAQRREREAQVGCMFLRWPAVHEGMHACLPCALTAQHLHVQAAACQECAASGKR